jgi:hypothetical protein
MGPSQDAVRGQHTIQANMSPSMGGNSGTYNNIKMNKALRGNSVDAAQNSNGLADGLRKHNHHL